MHHPGVFVSYDHTVFKEVTGKGENILEFRFTILEVVIIVTYIRCGGRVLINSTHRNS